MTLIEDRPLAAAAEPGASTAAERPRRRWRRLVAWLIVLLMLIGGTAIAARLVTSPPVSGGMLDPEGPGENGARALAEILRQQGVEVTVVRSHADVRDELDDGATLAMADPVYLTDEAVQAMVADAPRTVLLSGSARMLRLFHLGEYAPGLSSEVGADCDVPEFARVGTILPGGMFAPADSVDGCFTGEDGGAAVLSDDFSSQRISLVDGTVLFTNGHLAENGNAALGLALLGQTGRVVWYVPSAADSDISGETPDTLGSLTPGWVTPAILTLLLAGLAAAFWRGRRFGPLVAETLPVTVRASETMHGRARLTAKAADAPHAAEAIREGTVRRLAQRLALGDRTAAHEVADAASDRLRIPRGTLQELLAGPPPADDQQLVDLARRLAELEDAVDAALHPDLRTPNPDDPSRSGRTTL
ncbi:MULTISPECIES: DUF4350 domain-containing protein [unclassified Microbacterium]|uniref:DUF4350 domain-containing protein n=1 Tax=unclassified Microbacterium TaxID=2609290 RepID=UPI0012FC28AE|nr:DUF4350 domain-containing protein [Microbacterium sp. MAH-37]MVQ41799.1 DUF4350 domain-containing protein [Microbacterium sp. MAH-37]